jgi:mannobiose 2-epimerase
MNSVSEAVEIGLRSSEFPNEPNVAWCATTSVDVARLEGLARQANDDLLNRIVPFWLELEDKSYGGYFSSVDFNGDIDPQEKKSAVFVARLLFFFSEVHRVIGHPQAAAHAERTKRFLLDRLEDRVNGGFFWSVTANGLPFEVEKHLYAQAFGIYGLSAYARAFADPEAAEAALRIFRVIAERAFGRYGFMESFDRSWRAIPCSEPSKGPRMLKSLRANVRALVGSKGVAAAQRVFGMTAEQAFGRHGGSAKPQRSPMLQLAPRTMNTHLHALEALTLLADLELDPEPKMMLATLVRLVLDRFLSVDKTHSHALLTEQLEPVPGPINFGHDIEACWLIEKAAEVLADHRVQAEARAAVATLARATIAAAQMDDGSFILERRADGTPDPWRVWWVQAEALVGLVNEVEHGGMSDGLARAERLWSYIAAHMRDPAGDWYFRVGPTGAPDPTMHKVGPWKEPYHQGRACMELIERARRRSGEAAQRPT